MIKNLFKKNAGGFSLVELTTVLAIIGILTVLVTTTFKKAGGGTAVETSAVSVIAVLNEAKSSAISSKNASDYGVRILNNKLISFQGAYGTGNKETSISNLVTISTSTGIGLDVIFDNVTGNSSASGTITITALNDSTKKITIRIYSTGAIEKN